MATDPLSAPARAALQDADPKLLGAIGVSRYHFYRLLHATIARLYPVDAFYVGLCRPDGTIVYPYNFDGKEYDDPNVNTYAPGGLTEWIVTQRRPYWSRQDNGHKLHRGRPFGDTARRSADAIAAPLLAPSGRPRAVIGIFSAQSYAPDAYDTGAVRFLECVAEIASTALAREQEDRERRQRSGIESVRAEESAAHRIAEGLRVLRRHAEAVRDQADPLSPLRGKLDGLCQECERVQTETFELLLAPRQDSPLARLTAREVEVARLVCAGASNGEIAQTLGIAETTVKTHCAALIRKLDAGGRSGVAHLLRPYLKPGA